MPQSERAAQELAALVHTFIARTPNLRGRGDPRLVGFARDAMRRVGLVAVDPGLVARARNGERKGWKLELAEAVLNAWDDR